MSITVREIDYRSALVVVGGKLRGSVARSLLETLEELWYKGFDRVVVNLPGTTSIDTLGVIAFDHALTLGQELHIVTAPGIDLDDYYEIDITRIGRVTAYHSLDDALYRVTSLEDSGVAISL